MADKKDEEELPAGNVKKGEEYPKTQAKESSPAEFTRTYSMHVWPPHEHVSRFDEFARRLQDEARAEGLVPSKDVEVEEVRGDGGVTYVTYKTRVKKKAGS
jgi:hypothetical protein